MKQIPLLAAGLFAVVAALALNANAASETHTNTQPDVVMQHDSMRKGMKPHSHMDEKLGIAASSRETRANEAMPAKPNPAADKRKHFHPRDGK